MTNQGFGARTCWRAAEQKWKRWRYRLPGLKLAGAEPGGEVVGLDGDEIGGQA
jgi:hypothetical protein